MDSAWQGLFIFAVVWFLVHGVLIGLTPDSVPNDDPSLLLGCSSMFVGTCLLVLAAIFVYIVLHVRIV